MNKTWINLMMGVGLAGSVALAAGTANAQDRAEADYINYCAACHGVDGTGNGPMASAMKTKPTDLTLLAKNSSGTFPYVKLVRIIDGSLETGSLRSHSSHEMPVWGNVFRRDASTDDNSYVAAQARIMNIVTYISAKQK
jgi:mono/diheme cytochrome c family protein